MIKKIEKEHNGKCLSTKYINYRSRLKWKCKEGHIWYASYDSVKSKKTWCPYCAGLAKLTIEEMQQLAERRGGKCLSKEYVDAHTKLKWICKEGHEWEAEPRSVKNDGTWCPQCYKYRNFVMNADILDSILTSVELSSPICKKDREYIKREILNKQRTY